MRVWISSLFLALLILGSAVSVSLPFSSARNSQSILFGTVILEIIDVNVNENTTHAGAVIDIVTTVNASWDVIDFSAFHVETYYDSQLIDTHVLYVMETGQEIINVTSIWNTTGVEPGLYTISAIAYGSNIDNYVDGFIQILPPPRIWIVDDDGPADFSTIQEAINVSNDGDTVFVRSGTYYEHVIVNKTLSLVGENRDSAVVDGSNDGYVVDVTAENVNISQFTLQNSGPSWSGVNVESSRTVIRDNIMIDNHGGVWVQPGSLNTTISGNDIFNKQPIYADGIRLWSSGTLVVGNTITNESSGIGVDASGNTIEGNLIANNSIGIGNSPGNLFFHNSFVNNGLQATAGGNNSWDTGYPFGGNYWSDYNGSDLYLGPAQDQLGSDGIGDTPYLIDVNNIDHYPLMNPWTPPDAAALNISSTKTILGQGFSTNVTVQLENQGNKIEELNSTFYANENLIGYQTFILGSNNSVIYSSDWNLGSLAKGNYSLSVRIVPLEGETDLNDNSLNGSWIFISIPGDLNGDKIVDIYDAILLVGCFNSFPYSPHWNPNRDINNDGIIDLFDALILASHYGESWT